MCLGVVLLGLILFETLCPSWTWLFVSFPRLGKFLASMFSNMFSAPFSVSLLLLKPPLMQMLVSLMLS